MEINPNNTHSHEPENESSSGTSKNDASQKMSKSNNQT